MGLDHLDVIAELKDKYISCARSNRTVCFAKGTHDTTPMRAARAAITRDSAGYTLANENHSFYICKCTYVYMAVYVYILGYIISFVRYFRLSPMCIIFIF